MKYAVQYAYEGLGLQMIEDTPPITYEEAIELYYKHKDDFVLRLRNGQEPILVVWEDVGDGEFPIYHTVLIELDWKDNLSFINGKIYKTVRQEIEEPPHQKNET